MEQNRQQSSDQQIIVGVGASAGGLEAFEQLLEALGDAADLTIVFVMHLDPGSNALLGELLTKRTPLKIAEIKDRGRLEPGTLYVCPPQKLLEVKDGIVSFLPNEESGHSTLVIDHFLQSLASDQGERAVGVILSGTGSDGTLGLKAISDSGGLTFAQEPGSAKFDSMPRSAAKTGVADHVLTPAEIARELLQYGQHLQNYGGTDSLIRLQDQIEDVIPQITKILLNITSHNFQHYKISTLSRRIQRRMQVLKIASADDYVAFLQGNDDETRTLFRELLIGVTAFFRDPDAFVSLAEKVLPRLFAKSPPNENVRIWVAGCANGSEAYSMAMLCREVMDEMKSPPGVQIFATDIDERALQVARAGIYPVGIEEHVSPERLKRFFVKRGKQYQVTKEIRDNVLFSVHNLISDAPFSRLDLISCRNLLIYLGPHLQNKLIPLFHYALRPSGYLFLGPSENITAHGELFRPLDPRFRISQRKGTAVGSAAAFSLRQGKLNPVAGNGNQPELDVDLSNIRQRILLDEFSPKSCVIDESGQILNAAANMQKYLALSDGDFQNNIIKMAASGLRIGLRTALAEAKKTRRKVQHENLSIREGDQIQRVMLTVQPMPRLGEEDGLFMIVFHDVGLPFKRDEVDEPLTKSSQDADSIIAQLERELETTRDDLEKSMQDMEAANEELKSSNEELLSMNEELQSTNEELESSKEEISVGIEMIARANSDLENLLRSTQIATVFLDEDLLIRSFTPSISEIYALISADVGRPLENFVPLVEHMPPLPDFETIQNGSAVEDTVISNTGRAFIRRVLPYESHAGDFEGIVVTFVDVTELQNSQELFQLLVDASAQIVWITNPEGIVTEDSPSWRAFTGQTFDQWKNLGWLDVVHEDDREPTIQAWKSAVANIETFSGEYRLWHHTGEWRWMQVRAVPQRGYDGAILRWVGMNTDIDARKQAEQEIRESRQQLTLGVEVANLGLGRVDYRNDSITLSAEAAALYGLGHEELTVSRAEWQATFHPEDRDAVNAQVQEHLVPGSDGHCDLDYRIILPTGQIRWISARKQVYFEYNVHFAVPSYAILIAQDITERKRAELNLAFLADLQTQMIPLTSVTELMEVAVRQTAEFLNLSRCLIVEFDAEVENADILFEHHAPSMKTIVGRHAVRDFHSEDERIKLFFGEQIFLSDTQHDQQDALLAEKFRSIGVGAYCNSAYVTDRGVKFVVSALKPDAYVWRTDELDLLQEIANRLCVRIERARTETELVDREAHLRRVINNQLGLVGVIGRDGKLLEVDDDSMRIAGVTRDDVIGKHFAECAWWTYDPAIAQKMRDAMEKGFAGEVVRFDVPLYAAGLGGTDQRLMIDFMMAPVFDKNGEVEYLIPSGVDISDRARAEEALRKSESRFRDLADNMSQFSWMADEKGLVFWYNKRWFEYTGTTLEEMQGWGWMKVQHPDHVDRVVKHIQHSWDTGEVWEDTFPLRSKEGDYRWFLSRAVPIRDQAGNILRWFGTNTDITERKESEQVIKLSEERLRNAAEAAGFGMLHVNLVEDTVSYSPEMKRMLGLPEDADQHMHVGDIPDWVHPDDREAYSMHFQKLLVLPEGMNDSLDHRVIRPGGETGWVRLHVKPVFTGSGKRRKAIQIIGTLLDITRQRQFEQSLKEAREMAEAANEAKSAFLANMSHEIRTPMTAILGYADLVSELVENEEAAAHLRTIRHNGDFLLDIINDILDLSKIEAGKLDIIRERFAPDRLVEDVRSIMEVRATENQLQLDVTYQGQIPAEIETDPKRLKQILINLVGNAIKFTMKGSVKVVVSYSNHTLQFEIIDSGIGMSKRQLKRLFQPFSQGDHTVNREFGGTGLGLAISQRLATMLGGEISVESESGKGSTFTATIDTGDIEGVKMIQPTLIAESTNRSESTEEFILDCHVLVVDDRRDIRFLSRRFLTQTGAKVTEAVDGEQAVEIVAEAMRKDFVFDLILLDMQMPKLDGYESARQLRKLGYMGPIIALTADAMQGDMTRCIECGCNDYLSKPIDRFIMLQMVQRYIRS